MWKRERLSLGTCREKVGAAGEVKRGSGDEREGLGVRKTRDRERKRERCLCVNGSCRPLCKRLLIGQPEAPCVKEVSPGKLRLAASVCFPLCQGYF